MGVQIMDCTLRDGANIAGKGFSAQVTQKILEGLSEAHVPIIEFGNAGGIGAYEVSGFTQAETDTVYFDVAKPFIKRAELGMFLNAKRYQEKNIDAAAQAGLSFLRCGTDAGDSELAVVPVKAIKSRGMKAFYSSMKAYLLSPDLLAEEAKKLESAGLDVFTVMDSAGVMLPDEVAKYVETLTKAVNIPIAFHGHNNLSMALANALSAWRSGATILDCCLMGMARSAGNAPTEVCAALMQQNNEMKDIDLYSLLECIDNLTPTLKEAYGYHNPISPFDLMLGISGAHSSFAKHFKTVAEETGVSLYRLIAEVSKENRKAPGMELMRTVAARING